jgi:L-ascorbate metabolism protein UlaG (beta-lactamase superfamily)
MNDEPVFLRQDVQVEPLWDQWYAWPHLIAPATAARNLTERHLRIMESYIIAPALHVSATRNPKMLGGPFVDHGGKRVDEVRALRDRTKRDRAQLIELSAALNELNAMLLEAAKGFSLNDLYARVPAPLRGYVELAYDLNNHPTYRLIEPLLYRSRFYDTRAQSVMLSRISGDHRPFMLSTPRLEDEGSIHVHIPFADRRLDTLFEMKSAPRPWRQVRDLFEVPVQQEALFRSCFTSEPPPSYEPYRGSGIRWRYFGHACILIETGGLRILLDPVLSYTYECDVSRYTYADLPDTIDYVLITHNHQDHILIETLLQLRHKIKQVIVPRNSYGMLQDPSLKLLFENMGFRHVIEMSECESLPLPDGEILSLPFFGEHADLAVGTKLAYVIRVGHHTLLFAADSCNVEPALYQHLHELIGDVDVVFIGMECDGAPLTWIYGPLLRQRLERAMDQSRRLAGCNFVQAIQIVNQLRVKEAYDYAMGHEPWLNYVMSIKYTAESRPIVESTRLIDDCLSRGIVAERLFGEKEILIEDAACPPFQTTTTSSSV